MVAFLFQKFPFQIFVVLPFRKLAEFNTHEKQLLARVREHIGEVRAQRGEFIGIIAEHLIDYVFLAVRTFVVGKREYVLFGECADERKAH